MRWLERFIDENEIAAFMQRADVVALPYRQIDQSGVLFTALAFGKPILATRVGGFGEIADEHGALHAVEPDLTSLARGLSELLDDPSSRSELAAAASKLADGDFSWREIARKTLALYDTLV